MDSSPSTAKTVAITGATSGIGLQAAHDFARQGAIILAVGRSRQRCHEAEEAIRKDCPDAHIQYLMADLSEMAQVRRLAKEIRTTLNEMGRPSLDVLVNNAGLYADRYTLTADGLELTQAVNHFAPFLLTHELLPLLQAAPDGRVVTTSSASHYNTWFDPRKMNHPLIYLGIWAYKVSKLANVLFSIEFNRRMAGKNVHAFAVDPGLVNTRIAQKGTGWFSTWFWETRRVHGVSPEVPARTILHVAGEKDLQNSKDVYWYNCHPLIPSPQAQRPDLAKKLWDVSNEACGIRE